MTAQSIVSPEDQKVTFVELFFDLVFVFSVTQVVGLLHGRLGWAAAGQAVLVFWLVWWAWTQFTWALNAADTTHPLVELGALLATAVSFFMAAAVPHAFTGEAVWFAIPYVLVRLIGLALYKRVASVADPSQHAAVRTFALVSLGGLGAVLAGGFAGGETLYWLWGLAILLDVIAAAVGGRAEGWNLHPDHFGERHGLFVIIALGETLIVAAGGISGTAWTRELVAVSVFAVAVTCALWWSYFPRAKPTLDRALEEQHGAGQSGLARDVFSLLHFPMVCGIIAFATAVEEAVAHPATPLPPAARLALALAVMLFVGGMAVAIRRATGDWWVPRMVLSVATAIVLLALADVAAWLTLAIALLGVAAVAMGEQRPGRPKVPTATVDRVARSSSA